MIVVANYVTVPATNAPAVTCPKDAPVGDRDAWLDQGEHPDRSDALPRACSPMAPTCAAGQASPPPARSGGLRVGQSLGRQQQGVPFSSLFGTRVFKDPRGTEWLVMAADGGVTADPAQQQHGGMSRCRQVSRSSPT